MSFIGASSGEGKMAERFVCKTCGWKPWEPPLPQSRFIMEFSLDYLSHVLEDHVIPLLRKLVDTDENLTE